MPRQKYNGKTDASTISGRLRDLGYSTYADYLASDHWQNVRRRYRESDRPQRCSCGAAGHSLHHLTYERLGRERLADLELVCDACHRRRHDKRERRRNRTPRPKSRQRLSTAERRREATVQALAEWRAAGR